MERSCKEMVISNFFFLEFLEDISPFRGTTDTPVLDFWSSVIELKHCCVLLPKSWVIPVLVAVIETFIEIFNVLQPTLL